jgi:hypothetical protein
MTTSPTILLGLGGIGSQIVQRVYGLIPAAERGDVLVHAFDTNVNDIQKLGKLKGAVTQVSAPWTVGQYLDRADPSVHDWFPSDDPILRRKNLTEGAGQIRCVARLAYRAAMDTGRLEPLRRKINGILKAASAGEITSVRVMVANSIAGGTGAGIFLQVALYMRELLDETFGRQNVLIRGAFVLPDVLVNSGVIKDDREIPSVRANSYACLKELDAIARIASTAGGALADAPTVDLEYKPNQVDLEGRLDHAINEKHLPFDFCFLFDFENTAGQNLGSIQNYLEQVSRAVHAQLFSPMAPNHFSQEDNQILGLVSSRGTSRYCGAGIARIEYPYRDILQYGALRWATDALAGEWLRPDLDFDEELRAYERDQQAGVNREPPDRRSRFIFAVDNYARGESPAPAFVRIQKAAHLVSQKGDLGQPKAEAFLAALESEIERLCGGDEEIARLESECRVDEARLGNREHTSREVDRVEDALARLHDRVLRFVDETRTFVSNRAVLRDCDEANPGRSDEGFRLNTWLFARPAPVHPLAARYILYQIDLLIDQRLRSTGVDSFGDRVGALEGENQQLLANLKKYAEAYNLAETDVLETAQERARNALRQPFWARHIQTDLFKEFVEEYREKSTRQLAGLSQYKRSKLLEHVLSDIQRAVRTMMSQWERYFGNLRDVRNGLMGEAELLADVHERSGDPSVVYVLATRRDKVRMWDEVRRKYLATDLPVELYRQMLIGQFRRFCEARQSGRTGLERDEKVDAMFRADVVDWCRAQLEKEDSLDRDVVSALGLDAETIGVDREELVASQLRGVDNLARPWAPAHTRQAPIEFWGLHPDAGRRLSAARREDIVAQLIESAAYSRYEIVRYRAQYGMRAEDFPNSPAVVAPSCRASISGPTRIACGP